MSRTYLHDVGVNRWGGGEVADAVRLLQDAVRVVEAAATRGLCANVLAF